MQFRACASGAELPQWILGRVRVESESEAEAEAEAGAVVLSWRIMLCFWSTRTRVDDARRMFRSHGSMRRQILWGRVEGVGGSVVVSVSERLE